MANQSETHSVSYFSVKWKGDIIKKIHKGASFSKFYMVAYEMVKRLKTNHRTTASPAF